MIIKKGTFKMYELLKVKGTRFSDNRTKYSHLYFVSEGFNEERPGVVRFTATARNTRLHTIETRCIYSSIVNNKYDLIYDIVKHNFKKYDI